MPSKAAADRAGPRYRVAFSPSMQCFAQVASTNAMGGLMRVPHSATEDRVNRDPPSPALSLTHRVDAGGVQRWEHRDDPDNFNAGFDLQSVPQGGHMAPGLVDAAVCAPDNSGPTVEDSPMNNERKSAAAMLVLTCAIDDESVIKVTDGTVDDLRTRRARGNLVPRTSRLRESSARGPRARRLEFTGEHTCQVGSCPSCHHDSCAYRDRSIAT